MSKFNTRMENIFDVQSSEIDENYETEFESEYGLQEYVPNVELSPTSELTTLLDKDLKTDYEDVRSNIGNLIDKGTLALDNMLEIARESEKARDFEVATNMIKTLVESSKDLLEIQKKMREITGAKTSVTQNIKQAVFVGSTNDLIKARKAQREGKLENGD